METAKKSSGTNINEPLSPHDAWKLWHQLSAIADKLWVAYEPQFIDFCINNSEMPTMECSENQPDAPF